MDVETGKNCIQIQLELAAPINYAWTLLTDQQHINRWWGEHVELEPKLGGAFRETWSDGQRDIVTSGEVIRWDSPHLLSMTWADDDWSGHTRVMFQLSEQGEATRLVIEHSGWEVHPKDKRLDFIENHAEGWSQNLGNLICYAEKINS